MSLSERDIMEMLKGYVESPEGRKAIASDKLSFSKYSEAEMIKKAKELRSDIIKAYFSILREKRNYFDVNSININPSRAMADGSSKLTMTFSKKGLSRRSLSTIDSTKYTVTFNKGKSTETNKSFTGTGVYDIFGLFTKGFKPTKTVYGFWWDNSLDQGEDNSDSIKSRNTRKPNDFIARTVKAFEAKYPDIQVSFPAEWGGTLGGGA